MVNRESNVFPGILGRVCDRPCEPACRRGRVEDKPVAICRLKRVAADHKDDISGRLPVIPETEERQAGGLHRRGARLADGRQRPAAARLRSHRPRAVGQARRPDAHEHPGVPAAGIVLAEEIGYIERHGRADPLQLAGRQHAASCSRPAVSMPCSSAAARPRARNSSCPAARKAMRNIHIGIQWLESVAFKHIDKIGDRVLIIGVGNTAMDCCRSSLRLGASRREGHGPQAAPVLQGVRVGARGRRERERRDRRQPCAQGRSWSRAASSPA